ncbi:SDR family NAD(P)-dependent oxidoreductase [Salinisphaera sp. Q1T1-3]|uniref:SDR family NAD(P)-dependent oxidoreductase n=1 Tax=Salinisphaera sp. Q1T1-3 TaxID=2321229 RepID=UPI000E76A5C9|nr:SDR family NAD(P)-dependent oxidoreductase [Salinisphaera sp. Q1T1-3]RJS92751.1 SDR family oxidoreductase [Salinisphaera sp. Q1T1-3]
MSTLVRDDGLADKVALISGAASGIGQALAVAYARAGAHVVAGYYPDDPHDIAETVAAVETAGGRCVTRALDVRDTAACEAIADEAIAVFGRLDIVVASAGILRQSSIEAMRDEHWDDMLSVDLGGVMRLMRAGARVMTQPGAMVAVSSIAGGVYGWDNHAHYAAAKSGLMGLVRSLAVELAPRGIRVNTVVPGLIETPQSRDPVNSLGPDGLASAAGNIPLGRVGSAEEVARVIQFLTDDNAAYVTGQEFVVDGGLTVKWPS